MVLLPDYEQMNHIRFVCGDVPNLHFLKKLIDEQNAFHAIHPAGLQTLIGPVPPVSYREGVKRTSEWISG